MAGMVGEQGGVRTHRWGNGGGGGRQAGMGVGAGPGRCSPK